MYHSLGTNLNIFKGNFFFKFFGIFHDFLKDETSFSEKITLLYNRFHSQILLNDFLFWQFSIDPGYVGVYGKLRNHSKIAPGGLCNSYCDFFPKTLFLTNWRFH